MAGLVTGWLKGTLALPMLLFAGACSDGDASNPFFVTGQTSTATSGDTAPSTGATGDGPLTTGISASASESSASQTSTSTSASTGESDDSDTTSSSSTSSIDPSETSTSNDSTTSSTGQPVTTGSTSGSTTTTSGSTGSSSSSTGMGSSSGSSTGEPVGGQPDNGMWAHCIMGELDNCINGATTCLYTTDPDDGYCTASGCVNPDLACDPAPADSDAVPICITGDMVAFCALDCSGGQTCPAGMVCLPNLTLDGGMTTWDICM